MRTYIRYCRYRNLATGTSCKNIWDRLHGVQIQMCIWNCWRAGSGRNNPNTAFGKSLDLKKKMTRWLILAYTKRTRVHTWHGWKHSWLTHDGLKDARRLYIYWRLVEIFFREFAFVEWSKPELFRLYRWKNLISNFAPAVNPFQRKRVRFWSLTKERPKIFLTRSTIW
jgi:hypothetical protein